MEDLKTDAQAEIRRILASELKRRTDANPRYSMRSFAKYLDVSPSYLLRLLRGNHRLSEKTLEKVLNKLNLEGTDAVRLRGGLGKLSRARASIQYADLDAEKLKAIGHWHHLAILALLDLKDFEGHPAWIATRLNISAQDASDAFERLKALRFIERSPSGKWIQTTGPHHSTTGIPGTSEALRNLQREILELSKNALERTPIARRSHSGLTVAFDSRQIDDVKSHIDKLRKTLHLRIRKCSKKPDSVYQLSISFFPLAEPPGLS